ncbi:MAG: group 1 truncated hemoglobin [Pseudomonadota bacterium]
MSKLFTRFKPAFLIAAVAALAFAAQAQADGASLYKRLGGKPAITKVVADFVGNVGADARINARFADTDLTRLKALLVEQICEASGGPCKYSGRDMKTTHRGMAIADADFNALVEDLVKALDANKVPKREQDDLLAILGPMRSDIVEK